MADIIITPQYEAIIRGFNTKTNVLIRIQGPDKPKESTERNPINLALVIDRSGSMRGTPLTEAKRCAEMIIDSLKPTDKASLVVYGDTAELLMLAKPLKDKVKFKAAIQSIKTQGMTALFDGWSTGAHSLPQNNNEISRVLLLSDGQANRGLTYLPSIKEEVTIMADKGISTSTYGLGERFNEDIMLQIADCGSGNAYYGETAEDLIDPFTEEFDLISNLHAKEVKLTLKPHKGFTFTIKNLYRKDAQGVTRLPNIAYDAEIWALVEIEIEAQAITVNEGELVDMGSVDIFYKDMDGVEHTFPNTSISMPNINPSAFKQLLENELVCARIQEIRAANLQDQAERAVEEGNWQELDRLLEFAKSNAQNNKWLEEVVSSLEKMAQKRNRREMSLELKFSSTRMRKRLASKEELRENTNAERSYLRRKLRQGKKE